MKVVFIDRDGVVNEYPGKGNYVTRVKDFHFLPGAVEAIRSLTESGHTIFVISNQSAVGRGFLSFDRLARIDAKMMKGVAKAGGVIRKSFYCPHRPDEGCDCRKPRIGLIKQALKSVHKPIAFARKAFFVGDTEGDIQTGHNAGCKKVFVLSGRDTRRDAARWAVKPDYIVKDLKAAAEIIQHENFSRPRHRRSRA